MWGAGRVFRRAAAALQGRAERDLRAADGDGGGAVLGWLAGAAAATSALVHHQDHHAQRPGLVGQSLRTAAATRPDAHARLEDPRAGFAREHSAGGHPRAAAERWLMSGVMEWIFFLALSAIAVITAASMLTTLSMYRAGLALMSSFVALAGLFILLDADLLAAIQMIMNVGGMLVMVLFVVIVLRVPGGA